MQTAQRSEEVDEQLQALAATRGTGADGDATWEATSPASWKATRPRRSADRHQEARSLRRWQRTGVALLLALAAPPPCGDTKPPARS